MDGGVQSEPEGGPGGVGMGIREGKKIRRIGIGREYGVRKNVQFGRWIEHFHEF